MSTSATLGQTTRTRLPSSAAKREGMGIWRFVTLVAATLMGVITGWAYLTRRGHGVDWSAIYNAAQTWREGGQPYVVGDSFFNPPPTLLLLRPFLLLTFDQAYAVWTVINVAILLICTAALALAGGWRWDGRQAAAGAWLCLFFTPSVLLVPVTGNLSGLVLASYALGIWWLRQGKDGRAGAAFALGLCKPQLVFLVLPLLLYKGRWRAAGSYCVTSLVAVGVSLPFTGLATYRAYLSIQQWIANSTQDNAALQLDAPGIHAMLLQQWPGSFWSTFAATILSLMVVAALAWYWRGEWQPESSRFLDGWSLLVAATILVVPYAHSYDLVLLILVIVTLFMKRERHAVNCLLASSTLLLLYAAPFAVLVYRQHFVVPVLLCACALLWHEASTSSHGTGPIAPQSIQPP